MSAPAGFVQLPSGFWVGSDGSGPYFVNVATGVAQAVSGTVSLTAAQVAALKAAGTPVAPGTTIIDPSSPYSVLGVVDGAGLLVPGATLSRTSLPTDMNWLTLRSGASWRTMTVPSPYAPAHVLHPSVVFFENGFNGYRYWMAYTPYPNSDSTYENPCLAASNDTYTWTAIGTQPLVERPAGGSQYNSDTDLMWDSVGLQFVLVFRATDGPSNAARLKIMTSTTGYSWTTPTVIFTSTANGTSSSTDIASPSIMFNSTSGLWEIIGNNIRDTGSTWPLVKITSASLLSGWDAVATALTNTPPSGRKWWHSQFRRMPGGAYVGVAQDNPNTVGSSGNLYSIYSSDGTTFYQKLLDNSSLNGFGTDSWYRPSFVIRQDETLRDWVVDVFGSRLNTSGIFFQTMQLDAATFTINRIAEIGALLNAGLVGNIAPILHADSFVRGDDATGLGTASGGGTYTQPGGPTDVIGISTNRAYNVTTGNCRAVRSMGVADYAVRMTIVAKGGSQYMILRYIDSNNFIRFGHGGGVLLLQRITAGAATDLVASYVLTPQAGDELMMVCSGAELTPYINGKKLQKTIEGQGLTTGLSIGMQASGATGYIKALIATALT